MKAPAVSPTQRRWVIIAGIVVAAVLLLVVLPGFLATRSGFFGRYPSLEAKYKPWSTSTHAAEASCADCHVPPNVLARTAYRARMAGEFYVSLVSRSRQPNVFPKPTNEACLTCHDDLRTVSPSGDLQIPHRAHVNVLKMDCVQCHNYLVHEENSSGTHTPSMAGCMKCHDGDRAKNECSACHTQKAAPATHRASEWLVVHPQAAKKTPAECEKCHGFTDDWCVDCHSRRPRSHGADWRAKHGERVKVRRNCGACHKPAFCVKCHGELPKANIDTTVTLVQ